MLKKFLCLSLLLATLPVFSGVFEEALVTSEKVFLYMYTENCSYCKKFEPIFVKISEKYGKKCKFVKVDAETPYGNSIMKSISAYYVPYIVLMDSKAQTMKSLTPSCSIDYACVKDAIEEFTN